MKASNRSETIKEYYFSHKMREIQTLNDEGADVINLGIGSPDLMPDSSVNRALLEDLAEEGAFKYQPYNGIESFRKTIKAWYKETYNLDPIDSISTIPLIGSKEGIHFLCLAYLNPQDEALIPNPGYPAYASAIRLANGKPVSYTLKKEENWQINLSEIEAKITQKTKLLFVNYPHMPTGVMANRQRLESLIALAKRHDILLCNDNPYSLILSDEPFSILQIPGADEVCIELNSLSKSAAMAGSRIGMMVGREALLHPAFKIQTSFSSGMFRPLQKAAIAALNATSNFVAESNKEYRQRRNLIWSLFDKLDCTYQKETAGLFVWAEYQYPEFNSYEFSNHLLERYKIFIAPGELFGTQGNNYIRASLCQTQPEIRRAIHRL